MSFYGHVEEGRCPVEQCTFLWTFLPEADGCHHRHDGCVYFGQGWFTSAWHRVGGHKRFLNLIGWDLWRLFSFSILGISEGECFEMERDSEATLGWGTKSKRGSRFARAVLWDAGRAVEGMSHLCWGTVASAQRIGCGNSRGTQTIPSNGILDLRCGAQCLAHLAWLLIPWSKLCHLASIQKCPGWERRLFIFIV